MWIDETDNVTLVYDIIDSGSFWTKTDKQFAPMDSVHSSILLYLHFLMNARTFTRAKAEGGDDDCGEGRRSW